MYSQVTMLPNCDCCSTTWSNLAVTTRMFDIQESQRPTHSWSRSWHASRTGVCGRSTSRAAVAGSNRSACSALGTYRCCTSARRCLPTSSTSTLSPWPWTAWRNYTGKKWEGRFRARDTSTCPTTPICPLLSTTSSRRLIVVWHEVTCTNLLYRCTPFFLGRFLWWNTYSINPLLLAGASQEMKLTGSCNVGEMFFFSVSLMPSIHVFHGCPLALYIDEIIELNFPPVIDRQKYIL